MKKKHFLKKFHGKRRQAAATFFKSFGWFFVGVALGVFLFISFIYIIFQKAYADKIYPGIRVNGVNFGGKTEKDVRDFFTKKNEKIGDTKFIFTYDVDTIVVTAKEIDFGYNADLLTKQAFSLGRAQDVFCNISFIFQAYLNGINLPASYQYSENKLRTLLSPIIKKTNIASTDALFTFENGRVITFRPSAEGQEIDFENLKNQLSIKTFMIISSEKPLTITFPISVKTVYPKISTDKVNNLGIKELIGTGTSLFQHSIINRVFNITLATSKFNGVLVAPNETFSFNKILGDVSNLTGFQQAYIIQNGRTVLGDGGGVCQVSTTFFRALLNAGLPIIERHAHAYRVGYYEQDSPPGLDATVYYPNIDLRFKNDTENYILIQTFIDTSVQRLTFSLYGTKDGRQVVVNKPVILSQTPAPEDLYQDDPTLPKGEIKQVDFAAPGANVYFTRQVTKNEKIIINDKFVSNFRPWQAVYLRGTKE